MAVNKPTGWLTHADDPQDPASLDLVSYLKKSLELPYLGIHHRLDREVSGVLVFSVRKEANGWLARAFEGREVVKEYLAVVQGKMPSRAGVIDTPIPDKGGKKLPALTRYRVETLSPDNKRSLVRLTLETGRTHQLRIHLAQVGCPILGDPNYGHQPNNFPRLLLHSAKLVLPSPNGRLSLEAPTPKFFAEALNGQGLAEFEQLAKQNLKSLRPNNLDGLTELLELAKERRACISEDENTIYRLVNATGDGLPGFTLDRYGPALVLNFYDPEIKASSPVLKILLEGLTKVWPGQSIYVKFRPATAARLGDAPPPEIAPPIPLVGPTQAEFVALENGLKYVIKPGDGLSVGLFPDMRQMRERLRHWAAGKTVLNCFSYTCGFGVAAMAGGATRVLNLDAARRALDWGKESYRANGFNPDQFDFVDGDVFDWLGRFGRKGQTFDIVLLDPPSFSTTRQTRFSSDQNYSTLVELAAKVVAPGGMLIASTNHAKVERRNFRQAVSMGLEKAGRQPQTAPSVYEEPDLDFPHQGEGYLKILVYRL